MPFQKRNTNLGLINCPQPRLLVEDFLLSLLFRSLGLPGRSICTDLERRSRKIHDQCLYIRHHDLCDMYVRMPNKGSGQSLYCSSCK
mmetsp:Transcript_21695/g.51096  ORF Transcript_21695/g.51096 Transcript_21695/m.51096 type:complete len:87 (+) Transcript_21695:161-421(+)